MIDSEDVPPFVKAVGKMRSMGVDYKLDASTGQLVFVVPKDLEERLRKQYNFSADMLKIGGDLPLTDLAVHIDEQSGMEYHSGMVAELVRYQFTRKKTEYEAWYQRIFFKVKQHLIQKGEKNLTDKTVESRIYARYGKKMFKYRQEIDLLEMQHRILDRVVHAAIVTKGVLLPTLRNILQGRNDTGIGSLKNVDKNIRLRERLTINKKG